MVVSFSKEKSNYSQRNILDILYSINDPNIQYILNSPNVSDIIIVSGDIHKSQFISDNIYDNFWFKIKAYINHQEIYYLSSVHFYVCYNIGYMCINPPVDNRGLPIMKGLKGRWELTGISFN